MAVLEVGTNVLTSGNVRRVLIVTKESSLR